ncbi:Serine hydroxymethyltransferase, mitochondrial [Armadillidium vulgare]|nr:Serine hydroxymethyltransferase, mitochondrial [Armadillidium vulgare]
MKKAGRQKESIWAEIDEIPTTQKTGIRVKCKTCGFEMQGLVQRLENHKASKCKGSSPTQDESHETEEELVQLEIQEAATVSTLSSSGNKNSSSFNESEEPSFIDISLGGMEVMEHTVSPCSTSTPNLKNRETPWTLSKKRQLSRTTSPVSQNTTKSLLF